MVKQKHLRGAATDMLPLLSIKNIPDLNLESQLFLKLSCQGIFRMLSYV